MYEQKKIAKIYEKSYQTGRLSLVSTLCKLKLSAQNQVRR